MTKRILACCLTLGLFAAANVAFAADQKEKAKSEPVEKVGVIEIRKADPAKKEKYNTVLLKVGEETFKLIPGKDKEIKKSFKKLESLEGKEVTVTGALMPAKPPKYPMAAILVESFAEKTPAAAPAPVKK